jgi:integrase/predicted DNA-binding transcriptional regulator AlpA
VGLLKSKLEQFVKKKGYQIVRYSKNKKRWLHISRASRKTGISRPTIYKLLEAYPELPNKTQPKYVKTFEQSEGYGLLELTYKKKICPAEWRQTVRDCILAWRHLGGSSDNKKDPVCWTIDDWRQIWNMKDFYSKEAGGLLEQHATRLRRMMYSCDMAEALRKFKGKKTPQGKHLDWYLHDPDIKKLIAHIEDPDSLIFVLLGISTGARASALLRIRLEWVDFYAKTIKVYEPKVKAFAYKYPPFNVFDLLKKYVEDRWLKPKDKLFPRNYAFYCNAMKKAGVRAGLRKSTTTHILKHTYISQAHKHGVSAETVVDQVKTELRTIRKYYQHQSEAKMRHEMQGTDFKHVPFHEWLGALNYFFKARYNQLKITSTPRRVLSISPIAT